MTEDVSLFDATFFNFSAEVAAVRDSTDQFLPESEEHVTDAI